MQQFGGYFLVGGSKISQGEGYFSSRNLVIELRCRERAPECKDSTNYKSTESDIIDSVTGMLTQSTDYKG